MRLTHGWIEARIPQQGRMCLLDEVLEWGPEAIRCSSRGQRDLDHPLRARGRLGVACGIEIAAQVMALHGALSAGELSTRPAAGLLASVRGVRFHVPRLDDVAGELICGAVRIAANSGTALYEFTLDSAVGPLLSGRATVVFDLDRKGTS